MSQAVISLPTATNQTETNNFSITGYLGSAPKVVNFEGSSLTEISLGVKEPGREKASWYTVVLWNKVGEIAAEYLDKGSKATVTGEIRFDEWIARSTGEKRFKAKLHVNDRFGLELHRTKSEVTQAPAATATTEVAAQEISDAEWESINF